MIGFIWLERKQKKKIISIKFLFSFCFIFHSTNKKKVSENSQSNHRRASKAILWLETRETVYYNSLQTPKRSLADNVDWGGHWSVSETTHLSKRQILKRSSLWVGPFGHMGFNLNLLPLPAQRQCLVTLLGITCNPSGLLSMFIQSIRWQQPSFCDFMSRFGRL